MPGEADFPATVRLRRIGVGLGEDGEPRIVFSGGADWEEEHGIAVVFHRDRVEEAGYQELGFAIVRPAEEVEQDHVTERLPEFITALHQALIGAPPRWRMPRADVMSLEVARAMSAAHEGALTAIVELLGLIPALSCGDGAPAIDAMLDGWAGRITSPQLRALFRAGRGQLHGMWPAISADDGVAPSIAADDRVESVIQQLALDRLFSELQLVAHCLAAGDRRTAVNLLWLNSQGFAGMMNSTPDTTTPVGRLAAQLATRLAELRTLPELAPLIAYQEQQRQR